MLSCGRIDLKILFDDDAIFLCLRREPSIRIYLVSDKENSHYVSIACYALRNLMACSNVFKKKKKTNPDDVVTSCKRPVQIVHQMDEDIIEWADRA